MTPTDLLPTVYLLANKIAPPDSGMDFGFGSLIIKVLSEAYGSKEAHIKAQYQTLGDLGLVAKASRSSQSFMSKPEALTIRKVFDTPVLIAKETGEDSREKKKNRIKTLLVAATDCEPQYLIRLLRAKMRVGSAEISLLKALGHTVVYAQKQFCPPANVESSLEEADEIVKQVYSVFPVYDKIIPALLDAGVWNLSKTCHFSHGVPIGPMLAKSIRRVSEKFNKFHDTVFT